MKNVIRVSAIIMLFSTLVFAHEEKIFSDIAKGPVCLNEKNFKFEDNRIEIYPKDSKYSSIIITENYALYIDDEQIDVSYSAKKLLKLYYKEVYDIRDKAIEIGIAGAKIGISGAKLGLTAVVSLPLLLFGDADEYEERMEAAGEAIEAKAELLEERADDLEEQVEKLEDIEDRLKDRVEELDDLGWF